MPLLLSAPVASHDAVPGALPALVPALVVAAWFLGGLAIYTVRSKWRGEHRDADLEAKGTSPVLGVWIRRYFSWVTQPLWRVVVRSGIPANAVTTLATLVGFGSGIAFAGGLFVYGGWLYILSGILDVFDGRLARKHGTSGPTGAVLDSVLDRYVDAATLGGLAWYYRETWVLLPALLALTGAALVSYIRARGEAVGMDMRMGLMQRPERVLCLGATTVLSPLLPFGEAPFLPAGQGLIVAGIVVLALSSQVTAAMRLWHVLGGQGAHGSRPRRVTAKGGVFRAVVTSGLATAVDFALVTWLVSGGLSQAWLATAAGCAVGAVTGFLVGHLWAFEDGGRALRLQFGRYIFVSLSGLLLNAGGVAVFEALPAVDYRAAWAMVRGLVFLLWSYPLFRSYVFGTGGELAPGRPTSTANDWKALAKGEAAG